MDISSGAGLPLLMVNLLFAVVALAVGFAAGAWVYGASSNENEEETENGFNPEELEQQQLDAERTTFAANRLRDLAAGVASDVGEHNASIGKIEAELAEARLGNGNAEEGVIRALAEISRANEKLQQKLNRAEEQIEAQAQEIRVHESDARTDSLTNIANRRAFDDEVLRRFTELQRNGTQFSLMILDVDHFKKFNDTHGHQAGDEVLRVVAKTIAKCGRDLDLAARYGGEEFAFVMPETESRGAGALAERVRKAIEAMQVPFEGKMLKVTASVGVAQALSTDDSESLIRRADDALYESKGAGRNRCYLHIENSCVPVVDYLKNTKRKPAAKADDVETAILDSLPGRTRFLEQLRSEVRQSQETGRSLALLSAQLVEFDRIEKDFGQTITRLTMDSVAQFLDNAIRERDVLGKIDEGRFVVLMPGVTCREAEGMGGRLSQALSNCKVPLGNESFALNTLMSVVELSQEDTPVTFIQRSEAKFLAELGDLEKSAQPALV